MKKAPTTTWRPGSALALSNYLRSTAGALDMTAQVVMTSGPDLSNLSEVELRAVELGDDQQLNDLACTIGKVKAAKPELRRAPRSATTSCHRRQLVIRILHTI